MDARSWWTATVLFVLMVGAAFVLRAQSLPVVPTFDDCVRACAADGLALYDRSRELCECQPPVSP